MTAPETRGMGMYWLWLAAGFLLFMLVIATAHALDLYCAGRYGYRPLALPNLAFMLIPHGVLLALASQLGAGTVVTARITLPPGASWVLAALAISALVLMLVTLTRRTNARIALTATVLMTAAASILLFSVFFRDLADTPSDHER